MSSQCVPLTMNYPNITATAARELFVLGYTESISVNSIFSGSLLKESSHDTGQQ